MDDQTSSVLGSPEVWVILLGPSHSIIPKYGSNLCPSMDEWTKKMIDTHTHTHTLHIHTQWTIAAAAKSCQSCPTLCDPIDGSPPGSSVHGILQARVLEWDAIAFSIWTTTQP